MLGSLIVPSIVLHQGVALATKGFNKVQRFQRWGPSAVGLAMIRESFRRGEASERCLLAHLLARAALC